MIEEKENKTETKKKLGKKIKKYREEKSMTREELAKLVGLSIYAITKYEQGQREPDTHTLIKIANGLDVPSWKLISDTEENGMDYLVNKAYENAFDLAADNLKNNHNMSDSYINQAIKKMKTETNYENNILSKINALNDDGKNEALKRIEELTQLEKYKK